MRAVPPGYSLRADAGVGRAAKLPSGGTVTPAAMREIELEAFRLINEERDEAGLGPLIWSDRIADVARLHSGNMAEYDFFSHKGLDGMMVDERASQLKMGSWNAIGENIAFMKGYQNPASTAVEKWLQSPAHKRNMMDPNWTESAIGLGVTPDGKYYFTQVFIRN